MSDTEMTLLDALAEIRKKAEPFRRAKESLASEIWRIADTAIRAAGGV